MPYATDLHRAHVHTKVSYRPATGRSLFREGSHHRAVSCVAIEKSENTNDSRISRNEVLEMRSIFGQKMISTTTNGMRTNKKL